MQFNNDNIIAICKDKTIYRDGDYALKVFGDSYPKQDVLNEALNQARVELTGLNIPKIHEITTINGKWTIVMDYIEGKTLSQIWEENPEKLDEYIEQFVVLQMDVQSHNCQLLVRLKDKMHGKISASAFSATVRYDLHTTLESMPKHLKLCHGDFNPSNIIITPDGSPCYIDWAHATQGNASADVARSYLLFCLNGREDIEKKYLRCFCKKSDTAIQYVQKWMPIVAASQSLKGNEAEKDFLSSWVNVVDYT
jgi:RIO-like serine/threonine protein kinase